MALNKQNRKMLYVALQQSLRLCSLSYPYKICYWTVEHQIELLWFIFRPINGPSSGQSISSTELLDKERGTRVRHTGITSSHYPDGAARIRQHNHISRLKSNQTTEGKLKIIHGLKVIAIWTAHRTGVNNQGEKATQSLKTRLVSQNGMVEKDA